MFISLDDIMRISTHSLTRRLTLLLRSYQVRYKHFNSQPHEEADQHLQLLFFYILYFNSQPHEEADHSTATVLRLYPYFNSQPHEEADQHL